MHTGELLHKIIQSLDKSEQRFFKIYASPYKLKKAKTVKAIVLFDAIKKQDIYDETIVKELVSKEIKPQNYSYQIHQLKKLLSNALSELHYNGRDPLKFPEIFNKINLWQELKFPFLMEEWIEKGDKLGSATLIFHKLILQSYRINLAVIKRESKIDFLEEIKKTIELSKEYQVQLSFLLLINQLNFLLNTPNHSEKEKMLQEIGQLFNTYPYNLTEDRLIPEQRIPLLASKAMYHFTLNDYQISLDYWQQVIELFEEDPDRIVSNVTGYIAYYYNFLDQLTNNRSIEELEHRMELFHQIPNKLDTIIEQSVLDKINHSYLYFQCSLNSLKKNYKATYHSKNDIIPILKSLTSLQESFVDIPALFLLLIESTFATNHYLESLYLIETYYSDHPFDPKKGNIYISIKSYEYACHFELNNISNFQSVKKSIFYYYKKIEHPIKAVQLLVEEIKKINKIKPKDIQELKPISENALRGIHGFGALFDWIKGR